MEITKTNKTYYEIKGNILNNSSILRMLDILKDENDNIFVNIFKSFSIDDTIMENVSNLDTLGVVNPWWENLSFSYYGDIQPWWIMCLSNNIMNPFEELSEGDSLVALKQEFIPLIQRDMERIFNL